MSTISLFCTRSPLRPTSQSGAVTREVGTGGLEEAMELRSDLAGSGLWGCEGCLFFSGLLRLRTLICWVNESFMGLE